MAAKTTTTETTTDPVVTTIKCVAYAMFAIGVGLSITHIFEFFHHTLGAATLTAAAMPIFIDGFQIVGRLLRLERFATSTNAVGWRLQLLGATASLAANLIAGQTKGDKIAGAILVIGYITIEAVADAIKSRKQEQAEQAVAEAAAAQAAKNAKAAQTRAANKAKKEAEAQARRERAAKAAKVRAMAKQVDAAFTETDHRNANAYL